MPPPDIMTTPALLAAASECLFDTWAPERLAALLGVGERSVRRWRAGGTEPRPGVWDDLANVMEQSLADRAGAMRAVAKAARIRASLAAAAAA